MKQSGFCELVLTVGQTLRKRSERPGLCSWWQGTSVRKRLNAQSNVLQVRAIGTIRIAAFTCSPTSRFITCREIKIAVVLNT